MASSPLFSSVPITPPPSSCQAPGSGPKQTLNLSCFVISSVATERPTNTCPLYWFYVSRCVAVMHESAALVLVLKKLTEHRIEMCDKTQWTAGWQVGLIAFRIVLLHCYEKSTHKAGSLSAMMNWWRTASICKKSSPQGSLGICAGAFSRVAQVSWKCRCSNFYFTKHFKAFLSKLTIPTKLHLQRRIGDMAESSRIDTNGPCAEIF